MESEQGSPEREIPIGYRHFQVPCKNLREWNFYHQHYIKHPRPSQCWVSLKRALGARSFALHQFKSIENGASCVWLRILITLVRMTPVGQTRFF